MCKTGAPACRASAIAHFNSPFAAPRPGTDGAICLSLLTCAARVSRRI